MKRPIKQYIADIYFKDLGALHFVMAWVYLFAGFGMLGANSNDPTGDLRFLLSHATALIWVLALWSLACWSGVSAIELDKWKMFDVGMAGMGIWFWSLILFSSAIATPMESMSLLYVVCISIEMWRASRALHKYMKEIHDGT